MKFTPKAFIFDLNGTMIDDMAYHIKAWSHVLNDELHANLSPDEVKSQMYGKNDELLVRVFGEGHFSKEAMHSISLAKERSYQQAYLPELKLIRGLDSYMRAALEHGKLLAIGSAAIPFNIDFVLDNLHIRKYFKAIVSADDVKLSKPDPETYLKAADKLGVSPGDCIVFEDAPKGVASAQNGGMQVVAITTMHEKQEFSDYPNVLFCIKDYEDSRLQELL